MFLFIYLLIYLFILNKETKRAGLGRPSSLSLVWAFVQSMEESELGCRWPVFFTVSDLDIDIPQCCKIMAWVGLLADLCNIVSHEG